MKLKLITASALALALGAALGRAEPTLTVGDKAPPSPSGEWVQGEPVKAFEKGKAYLLEFWATWCGPCRASIPHLNEIYEKYKDKGLIVIGQDCWEQNDDQVAPFVKKMGDKMTYRVVLDDKRDNSKGQMAEAWMKAADRNGIPCAFLVDKQGVIAWIGHPMELKETAIEEVLAGKFDVAKAAGEYRQQAKNEEQVQTISTEITLAMQKKHWEEAMAKVDDLEKLLPTKAGASLDMLRFNILLNKGDYPAAYKLAAQVSEAHKDESLLQNELAWKIATQPGLVQRDLPLAETIATRANEAAQGNEAGILDTLARVLFMEGKKEEAVQRETKAVELTQGKEKDALQKVLDSYKRGELPAAE